MQAREIRRPGRAPLGPLGSLRRGGPCPRGGLGVAARLERDDGRVAAAAPAQVGREHAHAAARAGVRDRDVHARQRRPPGCRARWCEREAQSVPGARPGGAASAAARNQSVSQQIRVNVATTQQRSEFSEQRQHRPDAC